MKENRKDKDLERNERVGELIKDSLGIIQDAIDDGLRDYEVLGAMEIVIKSTYEAFSKKVDESLAKEATDIRVAKDPMYG